MAGEGGEIEGEDMMGAGEAAVNVVMKGWKEHLMLLWVLVKD